MSAVDLEHQEIIHIVHNEGEEKPWEITFDDVSALKRARAILNYPIHKFDTEAKAVEVAEMLRNIIQADAVELGGSYTVRTPDDKAEFFQSISEDKKPV
jgi:uncharacterized protein YrzB (UPF0473 family)